MKSRSKAFAAAPSGWRNLASGHQIKRYTGPAGVEHEVRYRFTRSGFELPDHDGVSLVSATPARVVLTVTGVDRPFDATVPAPVVVVAVAVVLFVGPVVLFVIAHQVVERKAVVAGDKVDALLGLARFVGIEVWAGKKAIGQGTRPAPEKRINRSGRRGTSLPVGNRLYEWSYG